MSRIEQVVFTSTRSDRFVGYQIVASSEGIEEIDRREMAIWGPSHDSLLEAGPQAVSFNYFPLPSRSFCISKTSGVGWEYSGRGGAKIYTHSLVASAETLLRYSNHPLALARAASVIGAFHIPNKLPITLESLDLPGSAPTVLQKSLSQLIERVGIWQLATFVQAVSSTACTVAVSGGASAEQLISGLLYCLPVQDRNAISFSTGLKHSSRRPFRILPLPHDPAERREIARLPNTMVLDLAAQKNNDNPLVADWVRSIEGLLAMSPVDFMANESSPWRVGQPMVSTS
jgi:hypothetical protein